MSSIAARRANKRVCPLQPNEERFIHGGEAMWIKRSCTELLHYRDGPYLWGLYHAGWFESASTVDARGS